MSTDSKTSSSVSQNASAQMRLEGTSDQPLVDELELLQTLLPLRQARVLELGCGDGKKARALVRALGAVQVVAAEVDAAAHAKNLRAATQPGVEFKSFGAEAIAAPAGFFDVVAMFKSLHHVPRSELGRALREIHRVLCPGGLLCVSEPVFAGPFNEVLRLFHDEECVRRAAFDAMREAVNAGLFELRSETHFKTPVSFQSFGQFCAGVIDVTHTEHALSAELLEAVRARFESNRTERGYAFEVPQRIDILIRKD